MAMKSLIIPSGYASHLSIVETEIAIKKIKDLFQIKLAENLNLTRVSAPLFVRVDSGLNDGLSGVERPVGFDTKDSKDQLEIVQSLAKWKRLALHKYKFSPESGLYTDMNAIRRDEEVDNIHSIYVDQWDWEKVIRKEDRTVEYLTDTVRKIYDVFKEVERRLAQDYADYKKVLPDEIFFITSEELRERYPSLSSKEREYRIAKEKGAVFIIGIGKELSDGSIHDTRAADYDDWNLNGDIILYDEVLDIGLELSSMGIRVDREALLKQLEKKDELHKLDFQFHRDIKEEVLPLTIGGGIGQSRICMFFLKKAHIGEVQVSIWPIEEKEKCARNNIFLL